MLKLHSLLVMGLLVFPVVSRAQEEALGNRLRAFDAAEPVHRKITKQGASSGFLMSGIHIGKGYPCELAELVFYNGEKRVHTDRSSPFKCGLAQPNMSPIFDGDITTLANWPKGKPLFGYNSVVGSPLPYAVTHLLIATPNATRLKGVLTLKHEETEFTFNFDALAAAGAGTVYKVLIPSGEVLLVDSFPATVKPYQETPLSTYVNGTTLSFEKESDLNRCETSTKGAAQWVSSAGMATIELTSNARHGSGELKLPMLLQPGQTVGVCVDHGYAMWQGGGSVQVSLGSSSFNLDHESLMTLPNGDKYIAASFNGSGLLNYSLLLARGSGNHSDTISWAVVGNGFNRSGTAQLKSADAQTDALPIAIEIERRWGWRWFNHDRMTDWELQLDEVKINEVRVGKLIGKPEDLKAAHPFIEPSKETPDKHWYKKWEESGVPLPEWTLDSAAGKTISAEELDRICDVFPKVPLPKSNLICNIYWNQMGPARKFYALLSATDDPRVLNQLLLWSDRILDYRNGGDHARIPMLVPGLEKAEQLAGWSDLQFTSCIDGEMNYMSDVWDYACWVPFVFYTEYISSHPELWDQLVHVGSGKEQKTHFEMMKFFIDEIFTSVEVVQDYFTEADGLTIPRPWNRYSTLIEGFHHLRVTYDNLEANGVAINEERRALAADFVNAFLSDFFDPDHFKIYPIEHQGRSLDAATFCYAKNSHTSEDIQHGSSESALLVLLHESGLYRELFTPAHYEALCNTVKYVIIRGFDADGKVQYGATFSNPPSDKHGGVNHFPKNYINLCKDDAEIYDALIQQFYAGEPQRWEEYFDAVLWRVQ